MIANLRNYCVSVLDLPGAMRELISFNVFKNVVFRLWETILVWYINVTERERDLNFSAVIIHGECRWQRLFIIHRIPGYTWFDPQRDRIYQILARKSFNDMQLFINFFLILLTMHYLFTIEQMSQWEIVPGDVIMSYLVKLFCHVSRFYISYYENISFFILYLTLIGESAIAIVACKRNSIDSTLSGQNAILKVIAARNTISD